VGARRGSRRLYAGGVQTGLEVRKTIRQRLQLCEGGAVEARCGAQLLDKVDDDVGGLAVRAVGLG
jgi:hypothetical protein